MAIPVIDVFEVVNERIALVEDAKPIRTLIGTRLSANSGSICTSLVLEGAERRCHADQSRARRRIGG
jgi:hypothetical protein